MTVQRSKGGEQKFYGLSSDTKPTEDIGIGSTFWETDTDNRYEFNGTEWKLYASAATAGSTSQHVVAEIAGDVSHENAPGGKVANSPLSETGLAADDVIITVDNVQDKSIFQIETRTGNVAAHLEASTDNGASWFPVPLQGTASASQIVSTDRFGYAYPVKATNVRLVSDGSGSFNGNFSRSTV